MALKAGYKGLKDAFKRKLDKLLIDTAGMKVIKSIGDGLDLSDEGELSLVGGSGGGLVYETTKNEAGTLNGMKYYTQLIPFFLEGVAAAGWEQSGGNWVNSAFSAGDIDLIIKSTIVNETQAGAYSTTGGTVVFNNTTGVWTLNFSTSYNTYIMLDYAVKED